MKYKIKYLKDDKIKISIIDTDSIQDIKYQIKNIVSIEKLENKPFNINLNAKIDFLPIFKELKIMLDANLSISEALQLTIKNQNNTIIQDILYTIQNSIKSSSNIEQSLRKYNKILSNDIVLFIKLGIENGNIKSAISSLVQLLEENKTSVEMITNTLRYPIILFVSLFIAIGLIFVYVIPNFEYIFTTMKDNLPLSTYILLKFKCILFTYYIYIILSIAFIGYIITQLYKKYKFYFDRFILLKIPIISKLIQSYLFYKLFLLLLMMVKSKYQFQTALKNTKNIINNSYMRYIINNIIKDLQNGENISKSFEKTKLFDSLTIKLLSTAEYTSNYQDILNEIASIHKHHLKESIKLFNNLIEPISIFVISSIILWLILALMVPIWDLSSNL